MKQHSIRFTEIDGCGDHAVARAAFTESFTIGSTGDTITDSGKALIMFRKQADGSWLIAAECWNSNLPVSQALPEPQTEIG
jgi:ketosteroid isomerase-like protein